MDERASHSKKPEQPDQEYFDQQLTAIRAIDIDKIPRRRPDTRDIDYLAEFGIDEPFEDKDAKEMVAFLRKVQGLRISTPEILARINQREMDMSLAEEGLNTDSF